MSHRLKLFLPLVAFAVLSLLLFRGLSLDPQSLPSAMIDRPLPGFSLPELHDEQQMLGPAALRGEPGLLNVWATWCVSCRVEHPYLQRLADAGVPVYGLNYKDDPAMARQWLRQLGDPYRLTIVDQQGTLGLDLGVYGAPETYLIDAEGVVRYRHVGVVDERIWRERLQPLYREIGGRATIPGAEAAL